MDKEIVINKDTGLKTEVIELVRIDDESVRKIVEAMKRGSEASAFWLKVDTGGVEPKAVCSNCGWNWIWYDVEEFGFNYCPHCGKKMRFTEIIKEDDLVDYRGVKGKKETKGEEKSLGEGERCFCAGSGQQGKKKDKKMRDDRYRGRMGHKGIKVRRKGK